jgi:hypothetical protein
MHVADGALLIALATIFVSLEATWTALAFGGVGVWLMLH